MLCEESVCELAMSRDSGRTLDVGYWVRSYPAHTPLRDTYVGTCRYVATFDVKNYFNHSRNFSTGSLVPVLVLALWFLSACRRADIHHDLQISSKRHQRPLLT
jgi:hypothetical protein